MRNPYQDLAPEHFWRSGVAEHSPFSIENVYTKRFDISRTDAVAVAGSCFAQHVGRNMRERGFALVDVEPPLDGMTTQVAQSFGLSIYSARYGNIYTARQLHQLLRDAAEDDVREADFFERDRRYYDGIRPNIEPGGFESLEEAMQIRTAHLGRVREMIKQSDVFVFTFGLTEAWRNTQNGTIYPVCPGVIAGEYDDKLYEFVNFGFQETLEDFEAAMALMARINPKMRYVITVSPVPLTATASGNHVLPATIYSKSVLRAVCGALYDAHAHIDYFPSYELVSAPFTKGQFFEPNMRSVTPEGVANAMRVFFAQHDPTDGDQAAAKPAPAADSSDDDLVCEEVLLDAFAKPSSK